MIGLTGITSIAAGTDHSIFLKNDSTLWVCGYNGWGQLCDGTNFSKYLPVQITGLTDVSAIDAGKFHSLILRNDRTVWACGRNDDGQLGDGTIMQRDLPVQVIGLTDIIVIAAGYYHSLFLKNDSTTWACGDNEWGQLGDGTTYDKHIPVQVTGLTDVTGIAAGVTYSLFQKSNGTAWGCGYNTLTPPVQVQNLCMVAPPSTTIFGRIITETGTPIPGATMHLTGDDTDSMTTTTDGKYSFNVEPGGTYTITPSKTNDVLVTNGITSVDVLLMRRHILGNGALGSPYKIIAAAECNATGNTQLSTNDILFTRQLILGQITSYPINRLWQFVPSDYVFPDATNPFPFPTSRTYTNITTNQSGQDFIGIKLGDVNNSWDPNTP